jgi:hypothetical protein
MKNSKLIRFVQSLVLLPMITSGATFGSMQNIEIAQNTLVQKLNMEASGGSKLNQAIDSEVEVLKAKAEAIDKYFRDRGMPLAGYGQTMVEEAEKNGLDWRLLAAIAVRESTGGKFACKKASYSAFGWGSCKINFKSHEHGIETVARNLGGNNPNTAYHYANKTTLEILRAYNPPSIVPKYGEQVISIMDQIGDKDIYLSLAKNS